CYQYYSGLTF
nr:immunoglobulin light chain junction region [Macaca mulatta]MOX50506.1 immunoglobulin light chain junction region [Macaca mulatta]MOX50729.1 immunoglobulin light chain junction region [Macaca mulatta]